MDNGNENEEDVRFFYIQNSYRNNLFGSFFIHKFLRRIWVKNSIK